MAVAAESYAVPIASRYDRSDQGDQYGHDWRDAQDRLALDDYLSVDDIPEVAEARRAERIGAWALLEMRREERRGSPEGFAPPVDALSTARSVLEAGRQYGEGSPQHRERYQGLLLDCQRLVAEWYRKKKPEYFPPVRHYFDAESQEFFSHGLSIRQMTANALLPIANNPEEEARRVNERVEDATPRLVRRRLGGLALAGATAGSGVGTGVAIRTISQCTDKAIADYESDMAAGAAHRGYDGYVPEIQKLMLRDIRLSKETDDRFEEQIGLPGIYITHFVIQQALARRGIDAEALDKTGLHGTQILAGDDLMEFVALLDDEAGRQWCTNIFMGEEVPAGFVKDYDGFRQEALRRQEGLQEQAGTVACFVLDLARDDVDSSQALTMVEGFVKMLLLDLAKSDGSVAEQMFDARTAAGLREVAELEARGLYDEAEEAMRQVEKSAPGGGYCGSGSCDLESVNTGSQAGRALANRLGAGAGDKIVKDKVRRCKCGSKSVSYAYNSRKVNKLCDSCGSFESKSVMAIAQ